MPLMVADLWSSSSHGKESLWRRLSPPQLFVGSFLLLIVVGTVGLQTIPGLYTGESLSWLDSLFTATSAVCVTGLIVVDTATYFTAAGQLFILVLIQLGGLGIITFTTVIIIALGRRLSLRQETLATNVADVVPDVDHRHLIRNVFLFTAALEITGACLLYGLWVPRMGWSGAMWPAVFHSVSAFCNAGFSVLSDSLMSYQRAPMIQVVIMALVVLGGIGFLTLEELYLSRKARLESRRFRLSLHSRIVLSTTVLLLVVGWALITTFEWSATLTGLPAWARVLNGLFASVTARTAGFNTIDYAHATQSTIFLTIVLMFVGGSPGSTAGGIKTTTFALLGIMAWSRFRGQGFTSVWNRSIPQETLQRAVVLAVVAFGIVTLGIFVFTASELGTVMQRRVPGGFLDYMFEAVSAFNTVGLSMGVTDQLSGTGRWTTVFLMFVGRVGPLTFAAALSRRRSGQAQGVRFAYEDVAVG